jgi:hypothetical protein
LPNFAKEAGCTEPSELCAKAAEIVLQNEEKCWNFAEKSA